MNTPTNGETKSHMEACYALPKNNNNEQDFQLSQIGCNTFNRKMF